jgi:hypothetical protein
MCIGLILDDHQNYYWDASRDRDSNVLPEIGVPLPTLETLLDKSWPSSPFPTGLSRESTLSLAMTLTSSVLQLHETGWLPEHWCKNRIHFRRVLDVEEPYVIGAFNGLAGETSKTSEWGPNPYLVNLGIVLLELAEQLTFESWADTRNYGIPADNDNIRQACLGDTWAEQALSNKVISPRYAAIVKRCLWGCAGHRQVSQTVDSFELWHTVYFEVFEPLREELERAAENLLLEV